MTGVGIWGKRVIKVKPHV